MGIRDVILGIALALSVVAFGLALWPAVADAPWEPQRGPLTVNATPTPVVQPLSQAEQCLRLAILNSEHRAGKIFIENEMKRLECFK